MSFERKLKNPQDVIDIRELYESGDFRQSDLAEMYGLCLRTVHDIINGMAYTDITGGIPVHLPQGQKRIYKRGEHGYHILTNENVLVMRKTYIEMKAKGNRADTIFAAFAKKYGVSYHTVISVIYGRTWKHLPSVKELRGK